MLVKRVAFVSLFVLMALTVTAFAYDVQGGTVSTGSGVNFRSGPSTDESVIDTLYDGDRVAVLDLVDDFYKAATGGNVGYIHKDYVETQAVMNIEPGGAKVTTSVLNLRSEPNTDSKIVSRLSEGTVAKIIGINNGWFKVTSGNDTGYVHPDYVTIVPYVSTATRSASSSSSSSSGGQAVVQISGDISEARQEILDYAATFLGTKYVYGGSSPSGFDCSGFTKYVFAHFNISLQRTASSQYSSSVKKIEKSELQPGDLVFFANGTKGKVGHVGIYVGNNKFIHATSPGDVVKYDVMDSGYYLNNYIGAGTVLS